MNVKKIELKYTKTQGNGLPVKGRTKNVKNIYEKQTRVLGMDGFGERAEDQLGAKPPGCTCIREVSLRAIIQTRVFTLFLLRFLEINNEN